MSPPIPINIAVEDELTESLTHRILETFPSKFATQTIYNSGGNGYLRKVINGLNNAAKGTPFLVGTDLDAYECPPALIADWLTQPKHHNLLIRVAVHEAEAWVLADRIGFADFLGIKVSRIPEDVESLGSPKEVLIELASVSRKRQLRDDICPRPQSTSKVGPNYNARLKRFVSHQWDPVVARRHAQSLDRTMNCLSTFRPQWNIPDENPTHP